MGISTAINWVRRFHESGSVKPGQIVGYRPKKIAGAHREWLMQRCKKDFTVRGLVAELAERGLKGTHPTSAVLSDAWYFAKRVTLMYGPAVRCKRFVDLVASGLASMYPASDWSICSGPS